MKGNPIYFLHNVRLSIEQCIFQIKLVLKLKFKLKLCLHCCRLKRTQKSGGATDDDQVESQRPASPDAAATGRPLSGYMKRFLSLVEHELDAEYYDPHDEKTTTDDQSREDESCKLPATAIVAVEVTTKTETAAEADADDRKDVVADDDDDEEAGLRLDKTRLVPVVDIDQFVGYWDIDFADTELKFEKKIKSHTFL